VWINFSLPFLPFVAILGAASLSFARASVRLVVDHSYCHLREPFDDGFSIVLAVGIGDGFCITP
jgi:hypothetical protein